MTLPALEALGPPVAAMRVYALSGDAVLGVFDLSAAPAALRLAPVIDGVAARTSYASVAVPTQRGGARWLIALRWPAGERGRRLTVAERARPSATVAAAGSAIADWDPQLLLARLAPTERSRVIRFMLGLGGSVLRHDDDPRFAACCRDLLRLAQPNPMPLRLAAGLTSRLMLLEARAPAGLGAAPSVTILGARSAHAPSSKPAGGPGDGKLRHFLIFLERPAEPGETVVVLFGAAGLTWGLLRGDAPRRTTLNAWIGGHAELPRWARDGIIGALAQQAPRDAEAAHVLREVQLFRPLPARRIASAGLPVGAEIELAIACGDGLFVKGWLHDPRGLVDGLSARNAGGRAQMLDAPLLRLPRPDVAKLYGQDAGRGVAADAGFVAFQPRWPAPAPLLQFRFDLRLRSGSTIDLVSPLAPETAAAARDAVLASVPADALTTEAVAHYLAPAAAALHKAHLARMQPPATLAIGPRIARPRASVIVPVYRNLAFLRFQVAAFATDPDFRDVELVYVLDSPAQRDDVERLLRGLHAVYGLSFRLLVMSDNFGYAAACNAGAAAATAGSLIFVNSDVVPDGPRWIGALERALAADQRVGAVGAKLVYEDEALQHAGLYFARDDRGLWYNAHYFKGYPRDFAAANEDRAVPAVTGAVMLVPRALFERVGGFSQDYIVADFEDSDFCLKLRAAGAEIRYAPAAQLYHFERRSVERHAGYRRGAAARCNQLLHSERWDGAIHALMERFGAAPATAAAPRQRIVDSGAVALPGDSALEIRA